MANFKAELITMLNQALELEHAARIQYLTHAEAVKGLYAEEIIDRLKEIAGDEAKHEEKFRKLIASYLGGVPSMGLAATHPAKQVKEILEINLKDEKTAAIFYRTIYQKVCDHKDELKEIFLTVEHEIRHIILDEEEHATEIETLLG
jgi:bacterioferritin (cytochrome b1)